MKIENFYNAYGRFSGWLDREGAPRIRVFKALPVRAFRHALSWGADAQLEGERIHDGSAWRVDHGSGCEWVLGPGLGWRA